MSEEVKRALALGAFDGLHRGHMQVINSALSFKELTPCVLTFKEDPSLSLTGHTEYLLTQREKEERLKAGGIKEIFSLCFEDIKNMSPWEFADGVLIKLLHAKALVCGHDFKFGKGAGGNVDTLMEICQKEQIALKVIEPIIDGDLPVSSTRIRQAVKSGDIGLANDLLGRAFGFRGKVVQGNKIGRTLGFPTINQPLPAGYVKPRFGVYGSRVKVGEKWWPGVTNIGIKPTVGNSYPLAETWIPGIKMDMYGMEIQLELHAFLRDEKKFDNLDALKAAIESDAKRVLEILESNR